MAAFDYDSAVVGMLTLRLNTPIGEWLNDEDLRIFAGFHEEAVEADGEAVAGEYMLLAMMNTAHLAIQHLAQATGVDEAAWLQRIALDHQPPEAAV